MVPTGLVVCRLAGGAETERFPEYYGLATVYNLDTQLIELALQQHNLPLARQRLAEAVKLPQVGPSMRHIRNRYLQHYFEQSGDYRQTYSPETGVFGGWKKLPRGWKGLSGNLDLGCSVMNLGKIVTEKGDLSAGRAFWVCLFAAL